MSAALIDLVSKGAQDVFITGEPQVSFFRQNYKRHTNFSMKPERMDYIGSFGASNEITVPIRSKGDLLSYIWVEDTLISNIATNSGLVVRRFLNLIHFSSRVLTTPFSAITLPRLHALSLPMLPRRTMVRITL